jgi:hypothetical protein
MRLPTKLRLPIFDPKKCYNPLSPPVLSRFVSTRLFSVPQVENEVKRTPLVEVAKIQEAVTDELKVQKRNFQQLFRNHDHAKAYIYMPMGLIFNLKKSMSLRF